MTSPETEADILPFLDNEERFRELSAFFVDKSVLETFDSPSDAKLQSYVRAGMDLLVEKCHQTVSALSGSPIERVFARSVMLSFLKNGLPLVFMPAFRNTVVDIRDYRAQLKKLEEFTGWYERQYGSTLISNDHLDEQVASGKMSENERPWIEELLLLYHYLPFRDAWHTSLQPRFPNLLGSRGVRSDMLFWKPSLPARHLVVECDGYAFHRSRGSFEADRQRDRRLKAVGYDVFRFTGRQINTQPVMSAHELFAFLDDWCNRNDD
jgi:Protein of unknown function (DUF559).